jgi:tetratricopeptide (TPR) repeat protein
MNRIVFLQKTSLAFLIWVLLPWPGPGDLPGAVTDRKTPKEVPGVETKIKQVPGEGAYTFPLWKVHWEKARQLVLLKKYSEAVQDFRQALALKPNLDEARQELSQVLITLERWGEAITELEILAEHQPMNQKVQKELADLLSQKKEYRRANERYQRLLQKDPDNLAIRLSLASNYYQINEWEKAMIEWRQVLIRDSQNVEARTHLAEVLGATKRLDESILILEGLVKQFPKQFGLKKRLAQALVSAQRNKEALPYLQELVRQDPADLEIQLSLAQVLSAVKHYNQSLSYLDTYLKKKPDHLSALLEKARALFNTGNYSEALEVYERLKKSEPDNLDLRREMAEAYLSSGKSHEALAEFQYLVKHFPGEYQLHEKIGELYFQNRKYSQAIPPFQMALTLEPENIAAQLNLARAYNFSGEKEKALPLYRAILLKRTDLNLQTELADILFETHQFSEAFKIYQQLLDKQPDLWEVRFKLATGLYRQKEFGLAAKQLDALVQIRPDNPGIWTLTGYNALEQGEYAQAQKAFQKVLTLGEDRSNILLKLGQVSRLRGRPWKGINYLDWALTMKPGDQEILVEKTMALTDGGGWSQGRKILESLGAEEAKGFKVQRAWFRLLAAQDRREESEAGWESLEKNFPLEQDLVFQDRAEFYERKKKPGWALTALKAAQIKNPKNLEIQRRIGRQLLQVGHFKEAESYYQNLEEGKILLDEAYLGQAMIFIRGEHYGQAKEKLWKALMKAPDSVRIRFWLWWLYNREKARVESSQKIEAALVEFSRGQEGGLLELGDCYREAGDWKKAYATYQELIEKGEDDDVLQAITRVSGFLQDEGKAVELRGLLEDLQKRFPRNQKITRWLIENYSQEKEYALAVKAIDGLLKVEDPLDPVLIIKKARLLERWTKHSESQALYQKLLDPSVDFLFKEKSGEIFSTADKRADSPLNKTLRSGAAGVVNPFFEGVKEKIDFLPLTSQQQEKLKALIERFKAKALIQQKVYLEKEGKDRLWRSQFSQSRPFLEELKILDPDNEEVNQDLDRSYRDQSITGRPD